MAYYRDRTTGAYTTIQAAQAEYPNVSVGNPLSASDYNALNIDPVIQSPVPSTTLLQAAILAPAVQDASGTWQTAYTIEDITQGLTQTQLTSLKQQLATTLSNNLNNTAAALLAGGFKYNFSAYNTDAGVAVSTLNPNGTAGLLTLQMDTDSQVNWLGVDAMAAKAIAACIYDITALAISVAGAGYTPGTSYALTAVGAGSGFSGTVDVDSTGNLVNPQLIAGGQDWEAGVTFTVDASAGTPTTPGVITATVSQPATFSLRVLENYNVIVPAADAITILTEAAEWKTGLVFTCAGLKDQLTAMANNTAVVPATMLTVTWPSTTTTTSTGS
jgi:hypothetical protein